MMVLNQQMQNFHRQEQQPALKQEQRQYQVPPREPLDDDLAETLRRILLVACTATAGARTDGDLLAALASIEAASGWARMDYTLRQQEDTALDPETAAAFGDTQGR